MRKGFGLIRVRKNASANCFGSGNFTEYPVNLNSPSVNPAQLARHARAWETKTMDKENLGPAERIIQALLNYTDHAVHNRPGVVVPDNRFNVGVRWEPVTHKEEGEPKQKVVYKLAKAGKKTVKTRVGVLQDNGKIFEAGREVGEYRPAGLFPEVAVWMYRQVAEVWKLDNEFAAKWASYAFGQEHRDLKVVLAAFMLCQSRKGDPVVDAGKVAFYDEDFRDVGEAMMLLSRKDGKDFNPKLLLRVHDMLSLPGIAAVNRELGFGRSARRPFYGRWDKAAEKWLRYREQNPKLLEGLVKAGFRSTVMELARRIGYSPDTPKFFEILRWKQVQAKDGRRQLAIGQAVSAAETWADLTEEQICEKIVKEKPNFKRVVGLLPKKIGVTRAVMAASIEAGSLSDKDLIIYTPTLEELGLLEVQEIKDRWNRAIKAADDMRAANIATRVKSKDTQEQLKGAADSALQKAVEETMKGMRVYFMVDVSGSMENAIEAAKSHVARFLQGFPQDKVHVSIFNTQGREIQIKHASAAGVENAFKGIRAGGGTDYGSGIRTLQAHKPKEDEDVIFVWVGDEEAQPFAAVVNGSGLRPTAFGFVKVGGQAGIGGMMVQYGGSAVRDTAAQLGIPCFMISEQTFADPYAIPRTIRALIAATPVGKTVVQTAAPRVTLVETILKQELLKKPTWCA